MIAHLRARFMATLRASSLAASVTMAMLAPLPDGPLRVPPAIVRSAGGRGRFDPREVVAGRIILTMPLEDAGPPERGRNGGLFYPN